MNRLYVVILLFAMLLISGVAAYVVLSNDNDTITYDLCGGASDGGNPHTYAGEEIVLKDAVDDFHVFDGWYLDKEYNDEVDIVSHGNITLYAKWETNAGKEASYNISGTRTISCVNYTVIGSAAIRCISDGVNSNIINIVGTEKRYANGSLSGTYAIDESFRFYEMEWTFSDGSYRTSDEFYNYTMTLNDDKIPTSIVIKGKGCNISYAFAGTTTFDVYDRASITIESNDDVTVKGNGTYVVGETASLSVTVPENVFFCGWYIDDNFVSFDRTIEIDVIKDVTVCAVTNTICDVTVEANIVSSISPKIEMKDCWWTVKESITGKPLFQHPINSLTLDIMFPMGLYEATVTGTTNDGSYCKETVKVLADDILKRPLFWSCDGKPYSYTAEIPFSSHIGYLLSDVQRSQDLMDPSQNTKFMTPNDPVITKIAADLNLMTNGLSDIEKANVILDIMQSIPYVTDMEQYGVEEYWAYPLQTLYSLKGDCEDTALLFSSVCKAMGLDAGVMIVPGHAVGLVSCHVEGKPAFVYGDIEYSACETIVPSCRVGDVSRPYNVYETIPVP